MLARAPWAQKGIRSGTSLRGDSQEGHPNLWLIMVPKKIKKKKKHES